MTEPSQELCQFWYEFMLEHGAIEKVLEDEGLIEKKEKRGSETNGETKKD